MNGEADQSDPALRRAVITLADHVDDVAAQMDALRKMVFGVGAAIVTALLSSAIATLIR